MNSVTKYQSRVFESVDALNSQAVEFIISIAQQSISERGEFIFVLSGGETPKKLYALLAQAPYRDQLDWKKTIVFWGDERCVPSGDRRNNAHQAKTLLFDKVDIPSANLHPIPFSAFPKRAAEQYEDEINLFFETRPIQFDLVLLGLGEDGHTASLFPHRNVIDEKTEGVREVYGKGESFFRITMTAPMINHARNILFLVTGKNKAKILNTVLNGPYKPENYPAQLIDPADGNLFLFADRDAAALSGF